jgi:hypothetical protein
LVDPLGEALQSLAALLKPSLGSESARSTEQIRVLMARYYRRSLSRLRFQLGKSQLALRKLFGQLSPIFGAVRQKLGPFSLALPREQRL